MNHNHRPVFRHPTLLTTVVAVAVLYFAREILVPFAVAMLVSFLLTPLVIRLRHWHFGKFPSVFAVMTIFMVVVALVGWLVTAQLIDLAYRLPHYQQNIHTKLKSVSLPQEGMVKGFSKFFNELTKDFTIQEPSPPSKEQTAATPEAKPVPVEIRQPSYSWHTVGTVLGSLIDPLIKTGIVIVLIGFMLLQREDMRDRLIRLIGAGHLNRTTKALDDAARRVSRYLLMQLAVNSSYGIAIGIGLYFMRVPNPILWGVLAGLLRFVPYLGIWIAALMPATVAFAIEPGWTKAILVMALFFGMDLIVFNLLEPLLYGASTGISPLAILLAAIFWAWLWGPIGLLLSTPLTVCVAVIGRYAAGFEFLGVVLTDKQVLPSEARFYQRLLAMDLEEATEIVEAFLKEHSLEELFDELMVPALVLAEEDRQSGVMDHPRQRFVFQNIAFLIEDLAERVEEIQAGNLSRRGDDPDRLADAREQTPAASIPVFVIPARDEADELCGQMLSVLLRRRSVAAETLPSGDLVNSYVERAIDRKARVVCISSLPTRAFMHARHVCKRLRAQLPDLKILLGLWRENDLQKQNRIASPLNCTVVSSLRQAAEQIVPLVGTTLGAANEASGDRKAA